MPKARRILLVNRLPPKVVDHQETTDLIRRLGIEVHFLETITRPPANYHQAWNTQFIVLDALDKLTSLVPPELDTAVLLLDSDCLFLKPLDNEILERIASVGALTYALPLAALKNLRIIERIGRTKPALSMSLRMMIKKQVRRCVTLFRARTWG